MTGDPHRTPDEIERYFLEDYFETVLPGFPPFEPVRRDITAQFETAKGQRFGIPAGEIAGACLGFIDLGTLPPVSQAWKDQIPDDLHPDALLSRPLPEAGDICDEPRLSGVELPANGLGCLSCGCTGFAVFRSAASRQHVSAYMIARTMQVLALDFAVPALPQFWINRIEDRHEHLCEADLWTDPSGPGGV